jgi:SAM-dependent methyltransferase
MNSRHDTPSPSPITGSGLDAGSGLDVSTVSRKSRPDPVTVRGDGLLPVGAYGREDEAPDGEFYVFPRKVVHIDEGAIAALGRLYAEVLPPGGRLLDLMSSWRSHLPETFRAGEVVGVGMNADEMADNPRLDRFVLHDVNREPGLPFGDAEFDGAMCAVSVQYLIHPLRVFREIRRVLRPGAPFVVSFSNRCFPTKAVAVWLNTGDEQHVALVRAYFDAAGGWVDVTAETRSPGVDADPLYAVWARAASESAAER